MNKCSVCRSPDLEAIHAALVGGQSVRKIEQQYGVSKSAVERHANTCAAELLREARGDRAADVGGKLDAELAGIIADTRAVLDQARATKDWRLVLQAIARIEQQLALRARIEGGAASVAVNVTVNLAQSEEWMKLRGVILAALDGPARLALAEALAKEGY